MWTCRQFPTSQIIWKTRNTHTHLALYRDDGLTTFKNVGGPAPEKIKKYFLKLFREHELELAIQCNRKVMNFLDVTLNLENSSYCPYLKDNNKIIDFNTESNDNLSIIKQLLKSTELRLSQLSANEEIFKNSIKPYKEALTKTSYKQEKWYQQNIRQNTTTTKNRIRNIIWLISPYSANVVTKVGKHVKSLLDKHFPSHNKFHKLFSRITGKIRYNCIPIWKQLLIHTITKLLILRPSLKREPATS